MASPTRRRRRRRSVDHAGEQQREQQQHPVRARRGRSRAATAGCSQGRSALPPSRPGTGSEVEHARGQLQERQERQRRPRTRVPPASTPTRNGTVSTIANTTFAAGPARLIRLSRQPAADRVLVDPDRAAGQADAAEQQEHHRQHERQQRVGVLERVERQVAAVAPRRGRRPGRRPARARTRAGTARRSSRRPRTGTRRTDRCRSPVQASHPADDEQRDQPEEHPGSAGTPRGAAATRHGTGRRTSPSLARRQQAHPVLRPARPRAGSPSPPRLATSSRQLWPSHDSASDWLGNASLGPSTARPSASSNCHVHAISHAPVPGR